MRKWPVLVLLFAFGNLITTACGDSSGPALVQNNQFQNNENNGGLKPDGAICDQPEECAGGNCVLAVCTSATCTDSRQNGDESDVDCGAIGCKRCDIGKMCGEDIDCISGICNDGTCRDKNCGDSIKNGLETDVDCGFLCGPCADNKACNEDSDCISRVCDNNVCKAPTCSDSRPTEPRPTSTGGHATHAAPGRPAHGRIGLRDRCLLRLGLPGGHMPRFGQERVRDGRGLWWT
ncbi:MAG: hypothetical protein R3E66_08310 [bacterium]